MTPEDILSHDALVLSPAQRDAYFRDGFMVAESLFSEAEIAGLRSLSQEFLERSKSVNESNEAYDLAPDHGPDNVHVRRLKKPVDRHPDFWTFASQSRLTKAAADLVGPDVKFHSCKLNYKWPGPDDLVKWHQDILAWPHTNYSPVTLGIYLDDVTEAHGPLACIQGSHDRELFSHYGPDGAWSGYIADKDIPRVALEKSVSLTGPAGSLIALNCRTVHGSQPNRSLETRPLLLFIFSSADAFPWMPAPSPTTKTGEIVYGSPAKFAHMDPRPCPVPPNWEKEGYGSIFASQKVSDAAE
jgi:ectoine hydroxylase